MMNFNEVNDELKSANILKTETRSVPYFHTIFIKTIDLQ